MRRGPSRTPMEGVRSNPASEAKRQSPHHPENLLEVRDLSVRFCVNDRPRVHRSRSNKLRHCAWRGCRASRRVRLGQDHTGSFPLALLPPAARLAGGSVGFGGRDLLLMNEKQLREVRGAEISLVYQDSSVLNPVIKVGDQVTEVIRAHHAWPRQRAREEAQAAFTTVGLGGSDRIYTLLPPSIERRTAPEGHDCPSPGMQTGVDDRRRTDSIVGRDSAAEIVNLIKQMKESSDTSFLFITHEAATLARLADRVMVMYAGQIVENGPTQEVLSQPQHPYTRALLECAPQSGQPARKWRSCITGWLASREALPIR